MVPTNVTVHGKRESFEETYCSANLTREIHYQLTCLAVLNIFLSIVASSGNALIFVALNKESSLYPPTKLLFRSLATTDLCVGFVVQPLAILQWMSTVNERWNICYYAFVLSFITGYILGSVSLMTLTVVSLDRLLALLLGLRYRRVVTINRTNVLVIGIWIISTAATIIYFWNYLITLWYSHIVISVCLVTTVLSNTNIFLSLRRHQIHVHGNIHHGQPYQTTPLNIARYKKAVSNLLRLQLTLVVCYLPFSAVDAMTTLDGISPSFFLVREFTVTLVYLNSSLNPILYCWGIREVRQTVKRTIRTFFCSSI